MFWPGFALLWFLQAPQSGNVRVQSVAQALDGGLSVPDADFLVGFRGVGVRVHFQTQASVLTQVELGDQRLGVPDLQVAGQVDVLFFMGFLIGCRLQHKLRRALSFIVGTVVFIAMKFGLGGVLVRSSNGLLILLPSIRCSLAFLRQLHHENTLLLGKYIELGCVSLKVAHTIALEVELDMAEIGREQLDLFNWQQHMIGRIDDTLEHFEDKEFQDLVVVEEGDQIIGILRIAQILDQFPLLPLHQVLLGQLVQTVLHQCEAAALYGPRFSPVSQETVHECLNEVLVAIAAPADPALLLAHPQLPQLAGQLPGLVPV